MKRKPYIWIVEILERNGWSPTVEAAITRDEAKEKRNDWQRANPVERFRVARYVKDKP